MCLVGFKRINKRPKSKVCPYLSLALLKSSKRIYLIVKSNKLVSFAKAYHITHSYSGVSAKRKINFKSCFIESQCTCNTILIQTDIKKLVNQQLSLKICTLP